MAESSRKIIKLKPIDTNLKSFPPKISLCRYQTSHTARSMPTSNATLAPSVAAPAPALALDPSTGPALTPALDPSTAPAPALALDSAAAATAPDPEAAAAPKTGDRNGPNPLETWVQSWVPRKHRIVCGWIVYVVAAAVGITTAVLGDFKPWKIIVSGLVCATMVALVAVFLHRLIQWPEKVLRYRRQLKVLDEFVALFLIYIYIIFFKKGEEREQEGHNESPDNKVAYGIASLVGFIVMALTLSMQTNQRSGRELVKYFLEELVEKLTQVRWPYGFLGALLSFLLLVFHSCKEKYAPLVGRRKPSLSQTPTQDRLILALQDLNTYDLKVAQDLQHLLIGYINAWNNQIPERVMKDYNFVKDSIPREVVEALRSEIANRMTLSNDSGREERLAMEYITSRKKFLSSCESELKPAEKMTPIRKWIKQCNIAVYILIPNEKVLCEQVFGESSPISEQCLKLFCSQIKQDLLSSMQSIPELMSSPEIVLLFSTVRDLVVPNFQSLFSDNQSVIDEMVDLAKEVEKATRNYYFRDDDFPSHIDSSCSCEVHPITMQVMHRLGTAFKDRDNTDRILRTYYPNVDVQLGQSLISKYIQWNIDQLEDYLEARFKNTYDFALQGVSIMANVNYILKKAQEFRFLFTMEHGWIKEQAEKMQRCHNQYRENLVELLTFLKKHNANATEVSVKKMLDYSIDHNNSLEKNSFVFKVELPLFVMDKFVPNCEEFINIFRDFLNDNQETQQTDVGTCEDETEDDETNLLRTRHRT